MGEPLISDRGHHRSLASHFPTCYYYCVKTVSLFLTDLLLRYWISIKSLAGDVDVYDLVAVVNRQRINLLLPLGRYFWSNNSGCFFYVIFRKAMFVVWISEVGGGVGSNSQTYYWKFNKRLFWLVQYFFKLFLWG